MNRRHLLRGMATLPIMGALSSCRREPSGAAHVRTLKVVLQGPFGIVLGTNSPHRVKALVPFDKGDQIHEFRFQDPAKVLGTEGPGNKYPNYSFELGDDGLQIRDELPRVDAGLFDFNFPHLGDPKSQEYFVSVDLPAPDLITFTPRAEPVLFGGRIAMMPLNHVLEYRIRDLDAVQMRSKQLGNQSPLPGSEMSKEYEGAWTSMNRHTRSREESLIMNLEDDLNQPDTFAFFLGVGVSPDLPYIEAQRHAFKFFNDQLVGAFPDAPRRLKESKLSPLGTCSPAAEEMSAPQLIPAYWKDPMPYPPHLQPISSTVDCQAGGLVGTRP